MNRFASTRSENDDAQPEPGRAQWSVGSIEDEGIRYGFATSTLTASTTAIATATVAIQSRTMRAGRGRPGSSRSIGFLKARTSPGKGTPVLGPQAPRARPSGLCARRVPELLRPPLGLALLELVLELPDVGSQVGLLLAEALLELDQVLLAPLELVLADLEVGLDPRLAPLDLVL